MPEPRQLLAVSADRFWIEALRAQFHDCYRISPAATRAEVEALVSDPNLRFAGALIDGLLPGEDRSQRPNGDAALKLAVMLRARRRSLPVLFTAPIYVEVLQDYALGAQKKVRVLQHEAATPAMIRAELAGLLKPTARNNKSVNWATVDIDIETEKIRISVSLSNRQVLLDNYVAETTIRPHLEDWQREYADKKLYLHHQGELVLLTDLVAQLHIIGERLHQQLVSEEPRKALEECLRRGLTMGDIHFRFCVGTMPFADVPFEVLRDSEKKQFIRQIAPLARRIMLPPGSEIVSAERARAASRTRPDIRLTGPVLFIESDGRGTMIVGGHRFEGKPKFDVERIPNISEEFADINAAREQRQREPPTRCVLAYDGRARQQLERSVSSRNWDIIHYSGHSVRADDGEVFLVLPGGAPGQLSALPVSEFAKLVWNRTRLVVMSSCEGTSSQALFRLAQFQAQAVAGFRWEVMSGEARRFSKRLHEELASGQPLGRAYGSAVQHLGPDCPAFMSAMLIVQQSAWAYPQPKVADHV
jgi:hypothetical protein